MPKPHTLLFEGISHLEDLSVKQFIKTVETLKEKIITEKLDGSNLWFGHDVNGFFTSREGKSAKSARFYDESDYVPVAAYNGFRAAHLALESVKTDIIKILKEDDLIEIEVMFGRQPNTVTYGIDDKNFIVMLRPVNSDATDRFEQLAKHLNKKVINVTSTVISSNDGETLKSEDVPMKWEIVEVAPINTKHLEFNEVARMLSSLKSFLSEKNTKLRSQTNGEVAEINLGSIGKADRETVKAERERLNAYILEKYKRPIKDLLLNTLVRKIKPALQTDELHPDEDLGVEGVVIRDPESGDQTKLVDKDTFTAINAFNSSIRNGISGPVRTSDQDAPIDDRGGILGQAKIRIATLLGAKELAVNSTAKKFVAKIKGDSLEGTVSKLASDLNLDRFQSIKSKVLAILNSADSDIEAELQKFKTDATEIKLNLKTGKQIGMSPEVIGRTLTSFAETKADISKLKSSISASSTPEELVLALYGRVLKTLFKEDNMKFNLLRAINEEDGGGEAAVVEPQMATSSGAIAPLEKRVFKGSKPIVRRARTFKKAAKFKRTSMFAQKVPEDYSSFKNIKFATDVDDNAAAVKDLEFKTLRNNITVDNANSQMDVSNYLQKAHEINDEVDSVAFGMENDDGSIIKVWVNAEHADDFEKALADSLGKEDDAEKVINDLANTYDIIDVEWPRPSEDTPEQPEDGFDGFDSEPKEPETDDAQEPVEEPEEVPQTDGAEETDTDASSDTEFDTETDAEDKPETDLESDEEPEIFLGTKSDEESDKQNNDETDSDTDTDLESDEEPKEEDEELDQDESSSELEDEDELTDTPPKKKKINKETPMETYGQKFKNKLLSEAKKKVDKQEEKPTQVKSEKGGNLINKSKGLASFFPAVADQAIISLIITLGAPPASLELHKTELRDGIASASKLYRKNSTFKMWVTKLTNAIDTFSASKVIEQSNFGKQLTGKYQQEVYDVMVALGLPETVTTTAARALKAGIKTAATTISDDSEIRLFFASMAGQLGVSNVEGAPTPAKKKAKVSESFDEQHNAEEIITRLLEAIGIDITQNASIEHQLKRPDVRRAMLKISNNGILSSRLNAIVHAIEEKTIIFAAKPSEF